MKHKTRAKLVPNSCQKKKEMWKITNSKQKKAIEYIQIKGRITNREYRKRMALDLGHTIP